MTWSQSRLPAAHARPEQDMHLAAQREPTGSGHRESPRAGGSPDAAARGHRRPEACAPKGRTEQSETREGHRHE